MAELSVAINGKMDGLQKALKDSEKALKQFEKKAFSISKSLERNAISTSKLSVLTEKLSAKYANGTISQAKYESLTKRIAIQNVNLSNKSKKLSTDLLKVNRATKSLGGSGGAMSKLKGQTINGNAAMTAFSRTIQDAPFGIMGVSNNITNLTEQFGYLKNKTGSSGGALKAMLRDLKGFGGITLAISLATSALLVFGDKIFGTKQKVDELTEATKGFIGSAVKEKSILESLLTVARDDSNSREKRLRAVKKINELFPKYLGNLKLEGVNSKETANKIDELTKSLINQATVKGLLNQISEISAKKFKKENKSTEEYVTTTNKIGSAFAYLFSTNETYTTALGKGSKTRRDAIGKEATKITELQAAISKLLKENTIDFDGLFGGGSDKLSTKVKEIFVGFNETYKDEKDYFEDWVEENPITIADNAEWKSIDWEAYFNLKSFEEKELELKAKLEKLKEDINNLPEQALASGITSIGQSIGEALANGTSVIGAVGMGLLKTLGSFLSQLGAKLILYGLLAKKKGALDLAMIIGGPAAIVAGTAAVKVGSLAVAAGAAISAFVGNATSAGAAIGAFAASGGSSGGGGGSVSNDASTFSPSSSGFSGQSSSSGSSRVVFEIQGTKLVGVLSNTLERNRALGGSLSIT